jgi:hypothetical protein
MSRDAFCLPGWPSAIGVGGAGKRSRGELVANSVQTNVAVAAAAAYV